MKYNIFVIILLFSFSLFAQDSCVQVKAAFDIGSGRTKVKVAKVDTCNNVVLEKLFKDKKDVDYKGELKKEPLNHFGPEVLALGKDVLRSFAEKAKSLGASSLVGVATSAFRDSKNSDEIVDYAREELGLTIHIIDQETEGILGFKSVEAIGVNRFDQIDTVEKYDTKKIIVWDIGNGSMQITMQRENGKHAVYEGDMGSNSFRDYIIEKIKKDDLREVKTPNPIGSSNAFDAYLTIKKLSQRKVPSKIQRKLRDSDDITVIGIGGVHEYLNVDKKQTWSGESTYTGDSVLVSQAINSRKTDEELGGGKYDDRKVSNVLLVHGFMKGLGIENIIFEDVNLTDGILIHY